jgi:predicted  nucleic acid-binding Zn-ribbon protein
MNRELELLLEIQDLRALRRDVMSNEYASELAPDPTTYAARLDALIAEREAELPPRIAAAYRRMAGRYEGVVARVHHGTCTGCFLHVPTSKGRDKDRHAELRNCESCGRFLWYSE